MLLILALCCFAFLAGFVDAMVGGGGLIQLPALFVLCPQLSLVQTLATNKTANFFGTLTSAIKYARKVPLNLKALYPAMIIAFISSFSGAMLVSHMNKEQFMPVIIIALLLVLIYTIWNKKLGIAQQAKIYSRQTQLVYSFLLGSIIGFYDGLIGPGTGSFLIFGYIILFGYNFLHASAAAKIINVATNIAAISLFLIKGQILWHLALPVGAANMAGSYAGAHLAIRKGNAFIRIFFITVVSALILKLSYSYL